MSDDLFQRFALYHVPTGDLGAFGAGWLGWDSVSGRACPNRVTERWTATARRYGFHATLKAPFRLAEGAGLPQLDAEAEALARGVQEVPVGDLQPRWLGRLLALVPAVQDAALSALAERCVRALDPMRAPLSSQERAKYAARDLSPDLRRNLETWGYPHVMGAFRFHLTLTDRLSKPDRAAAEAALRLPEAARGYRIRHVSLMGEDAAGRFHQINRYALAPWPVGSER